MENWVEFGYFGLFFASFLAATILPFSSEALLLAMIVGGFDGVTVVMVASLGNWLGGMSSYGLGYWGNWHWIETKLKVKKTNVEGLKMWIDKYGVYSALICWLPIFGDPLAIALGVFRTNVVVVSLLMFIGKFLRYFFIYTLIKL